MHIYKLNISQDYFIASIPTMKNKILNLPFKKLTSLFTALVFFCNIIAPLPAMAQKNQPKKNITLEQKIASIKENVTVDGIEKFKSEVERLLEDGKGVLSPKECWEAKPQTMEEYVAKCLYGGAFSEDDEIIKVKSQKPYAYEEIKKLYSDFNGQFQNLDSNKRIEMLEESLADIFPKYYQNEKAMVFAYRELENFLKKQTESYMNELLSAQYPKDWYAKIPSAFYPFPSAKSTIKNSLHFSQEGEGKLSKFFHYNMILSMTNLEYCEPEDFLAKEENTFPDLFRKCDTALLSHSIPETTKILKTYTTNSITKDGNSWIISEPISQMILARYLKEFSSTPESPVMLEYYMLLGFADMLGSQVSYVHSRQEQDLDVANENDIKRYYWACEYALDRFKEYKNHLKQGNSKDGVAALKDIAETSGLLCFSDWWRQDGDIEKWKRDYLSKLIHYSYGMRHWQVRRVIDITTANAYLLMKALIYVDKNYGSNLTSDQPLPSKMQGIIEPILQKITGKYLTWKDFEKVFRGETLTTENINKEGAAINYTVGEKLEDLASGPIGNGVYYYAKNGVDNAWEDTKKQGRAALGMFQNLSLSFYIFGEASKTDGDFANEVTVKSFSARTADFVSGLLELHKPVVPSIYPRIARVDPSRYWVDIIKHGPCDIGNKNHPNMSAVNNESCGIVDGALSQFDGRNGVYDEKDREFVHSTAQDRKRIKKNVNFYEEAGKFARDFAVDAVVDYVLFFGVGTITKFFQARKLAYAAKTGDDLNKLSSNLKLVVKNRKQAHSLFISAKNKKHLSGQMKPVEVIASKADDAFGQASNYAKKAQDAFEQGNNIQARYYTNKANELMGKADDLFKQAKSRLMEVKAAAKQTPNNPPISSALGREDKILYSNNGYSVVQKGNKIKIKYPDKSKKFTVDLKEGETFEVKPDGEVVITNSNGHIDSYPNLGEYRSAIIKQRNATSSNLRIVEQNGNTVVIKVGHNKQVKINLKEGDTLDINESGQLVFKDGKGKETIISIDALLKGKYKGKYNIQILGRSSAASGEAALEAHRGINGLMNKCPKCFENKNFEQIGKIARDNKEDFFDPIFADPTSKDLAKGFYKEAEKALKANEDALAKELFKKADKILGKKIYECAEPLVKKSVASDMARDLSYVRIKLVEATNGGVKAMPSLELDIDQLLQRQGTFKSNLVKRTTWNGKKYGNPSEVYIKAKPNGKGGYSYTNSKGESFTISKVEYDDIASFVNGEQGGLYIDLGEGVSFSDFRGAVKELQTTTMKKLKAKYPNVRITIKYGRGGSHEFGIASKNTKQLFINEGEMKHFHMEYEIIDENGTSIFYNTTIRVKGTDDAFQNLVKDLPVDGIFDSFASDAIRIQDLDDSNELFVEPLLISSYFIKEYDINGLYQNPLSCTNGRGFYFA